MSLRDSFPSLLILALATQLPALAEETPASQPASQPAIAPASQPASQPAIAPADLDFALEPETPARSPLRLDDLSFDLTFEGLWRDRVTRSARVGRNIPAFSQTNRLERYAETAGISTRGVILDERFARFDFTGRFGISQESFTESRPGPDLDGSPYGRALEYDLRTILFPQGQLTFNLFATQSDDRIPRLFLPSYDRRRERFGVEALYNDPVLPMRLSFESSNETWISPDPRLLDSQQSSLQRFDYELNWLQSAAHQLRLTYHYADQGEQYSGLDQRFETNRNFLTLNDTLRFGSELQHAFDTLLRFQEESGDLARDIFEVAPTLKLRHNEQLSTTYRFQNYRDSFAGQQLELFRGDFSLTHQLGDALTSTLGLYGFSQDVDLIGDGSEWGITPNVNFSKDNALGRFTSSLGYVHSSSRLEGDRQRGVILAESVSFRDPLPTALAQPNIIPGSLIVTNADRTLLYQQGVDYTVFSNRGNTFLRRIASGRIRPNETVMVSYQYDPSARLDVDRDRFDVRVEQAFKNGWTPYYAGSLQYESLTQERLVPLIPRDIQRHRMGLRYRQPRWSASGEFEYHDDSIDPFRAGHAGVEVQLVASAPHNLDARANASYFDFRGAQQLLARDTRVADVGMNYRYAFASDADLNVNATYRWEDDSLFGTTRGIDINAGLRWQIGYFTASVELEYDQLELPGSRDRNLTAWLRLRREFPVLRR